MDKISSIVDSISDDNSEDSNNNENLINNNDIEAFSIKKIKRLNSY